MKLKCFTLLYFFFLFLFSITSLPGNDSKNILKNPSEGFLYLDQTGNQQAKKISQTALSLIPEKNSVYSQQMSLIAYVIATHVSGALPTGSVQFKINDTLVGTAPLINRVAKFTLFLPLEMESFRQHHVEAIYLGDTNFDGSQEYRNLNISPAKTTLSLISKENPSAFGEPIEFFIDVHTNSPAIGRAKGEVKFYVDALEVATIELNELGRGSFLLSAMAVGNHTVTAIYQGSTNFLASKSDLIQQIKKSSKIDIALTSLNNPASYGQPVSLFAKASSQIGNPSGMIQFIIDGRLYGGPIQIDQEGQASTTVQHFLRGIHTVEAAYLGDERFNSANTVMTQQVNLAATEIELASSKNPSNDGEPVRVIASVLSKNGQPTGNVQIKVGGKPYGAPLPLSRNGQVAINIKHLNQGPNDIVVDYLGDENFAPSSVNFTQLVNTSG
ncbi:MAG: Ig-like domain-containing protein [Parachlamydiaceae bacterium]